jgi:hypothetical protein
MTPIHYGRIKPVLRAKTIISNGLTCGMHEIPTHPIKKPPKGGSLL